MENLLLQIEKLEKALLDDKARAIQEWDIASHYRIKGMEDAYKLIRLLISNNYNCTK